MFPLIRTLFGVVLGGLLARIAAISARLHGTNTVESKKIARRGFLRNAALGAVLVILAQLGAGTVRLLWPNKTGAFGKQLTVPATNVPAVEGTPFRDTQGKFYLVHTKDGLMALYWKCPHLGCTVPWVPAENQFHCPCHGSIYNYEGVRTGGPAPRPMDYMGVTVASNGDVVVDTGNIKQRSAYDPSQATPI
jgi:cytochrome b6-f complex iron-sulfur subunit